MSQPLCKSCGQPFRPRFAWEHVCEPCQLVGDTFGGSVADSGSGRAPGVVPIHSGTAPIDTGRSGDPARLITSVEAGSIPAPVTTFGGEPGCKALSITTATGHDGSPPVFMTITNIEQLEAAAVDSATTAVKAVIAQRGNLDDMKREACLIDFAKAMWLAGGLHAVRECKAIVNQTPFPSL